MPEFNPIFNLKQSPQDARDYNIIRGGVCTADIPPVINHLVKYRGPIKNQLAYGFCIGNSGVGMSASFENETNRNSRHDFSALWFMNRLKNSGYSEYPNEEGDTLRAALKMMTHSPAIIPEVLYPYSLYKGGLAFPVKNISYDMEKFKWGAYYKVTTALEMKAALMNNYRIWLGMFCGSKIIKDNWVTHPDGTPLGAHAVWLDAFGSERPGYFDGPNSWGESWGGNGIVHLHESFIEGKLEGIGGDPFPYVLEAYAVSNYPQPVQAKEVVIKLNQNIAIVDSVIYTLDQPPFITSSDRLVVPVRMISEYFGNSVVWDEKTQTVTIYGNGKVIILAIGSKYASVNDSPIALDQEPFITSAGRTMVPMRFISEQLGYSVTWFDSTKTAVITRL